MTTTETDLWAPMQAGDESLTTCGRIYALLQRIHAQGDHRPFENQIVIYGNQLMSVSRSYTVYFIELNDCLMNLDYGRALKAGQLLLQHETMLHDIVGGRSLHCGVTLN